MKTIEEKIYEAMGVRYFKKFVIWIQYIVNKMWKTDINKRFKYGSNYFISSGSIKGMKRFRFGLLFNTIIHSWGLYVCAGALLGGITSVGALINCIICTIINMYCLILQRYNHIRLERTIKAKEEHIKLMEERKEKKALDIVNNLTCDYELSELFAKIDQEEYEENDAPDNEKSLSNTQLDEQEFETALAMEMKRKSPRL